MASSKLTINQQKSAAYHHGVALARNSNLCAGCGNTIERNSRWQRCLPCRKVERDRQAVRRRRRKALGLCQLCGKIQALLDRVCCKSCLQVLSMRTQRLKKQRVAKGLCYRCGKKEYLESPRSRSDNRVCENCYLKLKARSILGREVLWRILRDKLIAQNYTCPYTGETLKLGVNDSVDHILPTAHYPELDKNAANIEWVTFRVNQAKRDLTKQEFVELVHIIAKNVPLDSIGP